MDVREMEKEEAIIGKERKLGKTEFLSNLLPNMKSCAWNKEEAENEEGMTDKKEAVETGLTGFWQEDSQEIKKKSCTSMHGIGITDTLQYDSRGTDTQMKLEVALAILKFSKTAKETETRGF